MGMRRRDRGLAWIDALGWSLLILVILAFAVPRARKYWRRHAHQGRRPEARSHARPAQTPAKEKAR